MLVVAVLVLFTETGPVPKAVGVVMRNRTLPLPAVVPPAWLLLPLRVRVTPAGPVGAYVKPPGPARVAATVCVGVVRVKVRPEPIWTVPVPVKVVADTSFVVLSARVPALA